MQLSPLVRRVLAPNPGPFTFRGTGVYLIGCKQNIAVIDPGPLIREHVEALKRAIGWRRLSHIVITHTHRDHSPAAAALKAWSGAKTYAAIPHHLTSGEVEEGADREFVPDIVIEDGMRIAGDGFTLECIATPGHTPNHVCYGLGGEQALFSGDHVMGWSTSIIAPPDGHMGQYLASLRKLLLRGEAIFYPTHGSPILDPKPWLEALIAHRQAREDQILKALAKGETAIPSLVEKIYPGLDAALKRAAAQMIDAHLQHLREQGKIAAEGPGREQELLWRDPADEGFQKR